MALATRTVRTRARSVPSRPIYLLGLSLLVLAVSASSYTGGAYDAVSQRWTCIGIALGFGLMLISSQSLVVPPRRVIYMAMIMGFWCLIVTLQVVPLPSMFVTSLSPWTTRYADLGVSASQAVSEDAAVTLSLIRDQTVHRLTVYVFALVIFFISAVAINTKQARMVALACISVSALGIASWGIFQRLVDAQPLPMGVPRTSYSEYFAGFSNENTGAASVSLGIAAALGLMVWQLFPLATNARHRPKEFVGRKVGVPTSEDGYRTSTVIWAEPRFMIVAAIFVLLITSVVMSLSRGAVMSAVVAVPLVLIRVFWARSLRAALFVLLIMTIVTYGALWSFGSQDDVSQVRDELAVETLSLDARWEHWTDGWALVQRFPFFGTGLGTYGYAQLITQNEDSLGWVREAHNQYLELLAETGVFGLVAVLVGLGYCLSDLWKRIPTTSSGDLLAVRSGALCAVTAAGIHSCVDFSYAAPSNLWLLACLTGMGLGASSQSQSPLKVAALRTTPWTIVCCCGLLLIFGLFSREAREAILLDRTRLDDGQMIAATQASDAIKHIEKYKASWGTTDAVELREATIKFQSFQRAHFARESDQIADEDLQGSVVRGIEQRYYQTLAKLMLSRRQTGSSDSEFSESTELREIKATLETAINRNPLNYRAHFMLGQTATLLGQDGSTWFKRCQMLNRARPEIFYACGLFALWRGDDASVNQQWRRCLSVSRQFDRHILALARNQFRGERFADRLAPENPQRLYAFVRSVSRNPDFQPFLQSTLDHTIEKVQDSEDMKPAEKAHSLGYLLMIKGDLNSAVDQFELAVKADPKNLTFRFDLASHLAQSGYPELALEQLKIASVLAPGEPRIDAMIQSFRKQAIIQNVAQPAANELPGNE